MTSHAPRTPVYESHPVVHPNTLPPPPPRNAPYSGPQSRDHGTRPPALTVIPNNQFGSHHSTPLSAISHQSPFSPSSGTPILPATGAPSRGTSPMASRQSGTFGVPYDPRDWAGGDVNANQAARARQQQGEEGLASPPPPYSPQNADRNTSDQTLSRRSIVQEQDAENHVESPESVTTVQPRSLQQTGSRAFHRHTLHMGYQIPPPPPSPGLPFGVNRNTINPTTYHDGSYSRESSPAPAVQPPTARRAVSANADLLQRAGEFGPSSRSNSKNRWQPGMPLPGPPPGPPPASSRSQSMTTSRERSGSGGVQRIRPLRHTMHDSVLGPVPPTPADWVDGSLLPSNGQQSLHVDTNVVDNAELQSNTCATSSTALAGQAAVIPLSRSSAVRDTSVKSLRERRAQNRNSRVFSPSEDPNLSVSTSLSSGASGSKGPNSAGLPSEPVSGNRLSSRTQAKLPPLATILSADQGITASPMDVVIPTASLSSTRQLDNQGFRSAGLPPKALPTPPLSHKAPLSAHSTMTSSPDSLPMQSSYMTDDFVQGAAKRHADFLQREQSAQSDLDRLNIFMQFVVQESTIRQQRYHAAFKSADFDVQSARERLFQPPTQRNSLTGTEGHRSPELQTSLKQNTVPQTRPESSYWKDYQPALSPIASMEYDEMSSRGRAPSRWWESQTGSQGGGRAGPIQRSKRESKYMGLSKEFLMSHSPTSEVATHSIDTYFPTANGYPQEKANPSTFGYYDEDEHNPTPTFAPKHPETPKLLDISRFITLPPPYPRHYPAVSNNHPDLANYRTTVRTLSDLSDIKTRRSRHQLSVDALRTELQRKISEARRAFRLNVQAQIQEGSITYSEAAEAEEANKQHEFELEKQTIKAEFDTLQDVVINPLHDTLNDRIQQLNKSIQQLQDGLHSEASHQDPDGPQEEGDETPELLEKLTQLKWLFDTREQIHKECFDILSERNDKYKAIVLFPYQWNKNVDKVRDTELFFEKDTRTRFITFCDESSQRHQAFLTIIEQHVMRGVELQSSAFWDIAPGLLDLLQKLPENMHDLPAIQIPGKEYEETPSYRQHPQQYLYSLLSHAEKSTYQFIEGQVNLHCLLHEAKTGMLAARYRSLQLRESHVTSRAEELAASRQAEEAALTGELKQKASMIEQQWLEALGSQLQGTRERVKSLLVDRDAWEEFADSE